MGSVCQLSEECTSDDLRVKGLHYVIKFDVYGSPLRELFIQMVPDHVRAGSRGNRDKQGWEKVG